MQGDKTIRLSGRQIKTLPFLHSDNAPRLTERATCLRSPVKTGSTPAVPGRSGARSGETAGGKPVFADFALSYRLPDSYLLKSAADSARPRQTMPTATPVAGHRSGAHVRRNHDPRHRPDNAHRDSVPPGPYQPQATTAPMDQDRFPDLDPGLAWMVCRRPVDHRPGDYLDHSW